MTIKTNEANDRPSPPEASIVVSGHDAVAIPFATATPVDDNALPPSYNPSYSGTVPSNGYVTTTTDSAQPPAQTTGATLSGSQYSPHVSHQATASPGEVRVPQISVVATGASAPPPPGLPPGGRWVLVKRIGPTTWAFCIGFSVLFCWFFLLPCGLWAFLCPCDERRAYLVNGKLFDEHGGMIGSAHSRRYR